MQECNEGCISNYWVTIISDKLNRNISDIQVSTHVASYLLTQKHIRVELMSLFSRFMVFTL